MQRNILFFCSALLLATAACHKHDHNKDDKIAPVLNITSPADDVSLTGIVSVLGVATDEKSLHEMSIVIAKDSDGAELFRAEPEVHDEISYDISEAWTPSGLTTETPVTLTVTVEDHGENRAVKTVKFKVKS